MKKPAFLYKIYNTINNKEYIGVTTRELRIRLIEHLSRLKRQKHPSNIMQMDYNKHGKGIFKIELINKGESDYIYKLEKELTKKTVIDGYNVIIGGNDKDERRSASLIFVKICKENPDILKKRAILFSNIHKGRKASEEAKKKMSLAKKGKKMTEEYKKKRSIQYSGNGNPNAGNFSIYLNLQTGIYYQTPDLLQLLNISKSSVLKYIRDNNPKISNYLKV